MDGTGLDLWLAELGQRCVYVRTGFDLALELTRSRSAGHRRFSTSVQEASHRGATHRQPAQEHAGRCRRPTLPLSPQEPGHQELQARDVRCE